MKPQKYAARRSTKENQTISTITSDRDGGPRHPPVNNAVQQQAIYDRDRLTQVKTYTDHSNGYGQRSGTTTHYSKVCVLDKRFDRFECVFFAVVRTSQITSLLAVTRTRMFR